MSSTRKNVLFLTVDALTYSRLGAGGAAPSPSPNLDRLLAGGLSFSRTFAAGCPTMFATPAIFTSTLPLDDGGYGLGIRNRGTSFVELFRDAGYHTGGFCTGLYQGRIYGYDRGFEDYHEFFELGLFQKILRGLYLDYLTSMRYMGALNWEVCVATLREWLAEFIPALRRYCEERIAEVRDGRVAPSPLLHGRCFESVGDFARIEARRFEVDPTGYAAALLREEHGESVFDILPRFTRRAELPRVKRINRWLSNQSTGLSIPALAPSGRYVVDQLQRWIERQPAGEPWFAWAHLLDCHDLNFASFDAAVPAAEVREELREAERLRRALLKARGESAGNVQYDLAIRYSDAQVARVVRFLEDRGLRDDTLLVVTSDHGGWKNGFPARPAGTDYMSFFDEMYHVPLVFSHPDIAPRQVDALTSSLDLAPTLLHLAGLPVPEEYRGEVASAPGWPGRRFVQMEHMGSGPCDFRLKNLQLCIRGHDAKMVCETPPLWSNCEGALRALFDLEADPMEQENLALSGDAFPPQMQWLVEATEARLQELLDHTPRPDVPALAYA
ncbi:MAG TPA: sulfatase-like hydrolase/transferase [Longimicrobiaceae bacterium]|nr:sulfatase-like hydrolase/transferase [Longimicrobiaceae bacterium]